MKNELKSIITGLLLAMAQAGALYPADELWDYRWDGVVFPEAQDSFWEKLVNGSSEVNGEGLVLTSKEDEVAMYRVRQTDSNGIWDGEQPVIVEFSARALEIGPEAEAAGQLVVGNGMRCVVVPIKNESKDDYRLEWADGEAQLWVNGEERPEIISYVEAPEFIDEANSLYFGDGSGLTSGKSLWYYIRWKCSIP